MQESGRAGECVMAECGRAGECVMAECGRAGESVRGSLKRRSCPSLSASLEVKKPKTAPGALLVSTCFRVSGFMSRV